MPRQTRPLPSSSPHRPQQTWTSPPVNRTPTTAKQRIPQSPMNDRATAYRHDQDADADLFQYTPRHVRRRAARQKTADGLFQTLEQNLERLQSLPLTTVVGGAMLLGALSVVLLSSIIFHNFPDSDAPQLRPVDAVAPGDIVARDGLAAGQSTNSGATVEIAEVTPAQVATADESVAPSTPQQENVRPRDESVSEESARKAARSTTSRFARHDTVREDAATDDGERDDSRSRSRSRKRTPEPRSSRWSRGEEQREKNSRSSSDWAGESRSRRTFRTREPIVRLAARRESPRAIRQTMMRPVTTRQTMTRSAVSRQGSKTPQTRTPRVTRRFVRAQDFNRDVKPSNSFTSSSSSGSSRRIFQMRQSTTAEISTPRRSMRSQRQETFARSSSRTSQRVERTSQRDVTPRVVSRGRTQSKRAETTRESALSVGY
jgi:hypothetical protein